LAVPITGFVSDGHPTISTAISRFLPNQANNSSHHIEISSGTATKRRAISDFFAGQILADRRSRRDLW
jgi:hypothetical protein